MKKRILIFNYLIIICAIIAVFLFGLQASGSANLAAAKESVKNYAEIYANGYHTGDEIKAPSAVRITVIDGQTLLVKSDTENASLVGKIHDEREELSNALSGKETVVVRHSESLAKDMVYYAVKVETGENTYDFIRAAIAVDDVNSYVVKTLPLSIFVMISAILLSFIAVLFVSNGLLKPIKEVCGNLKAVNDGTYKSVVPMTGDDEINEVLGEINDLSDKLQSSLKQIKTDKERIDYVFDNVSDGLIVFDDDGNITLANKVASAIFNLATLSGRAYNCLTLNDCFNSNLKNSFETSDNCSFEFVADDKKTYAVSLTKLSRGGFVAVLNDVTATRNAEKMRSEFFANASHELKTPLTAVKGFNDLVSMSTTDEKIKSLTAKIDKETERLVRLINDMLNLSELESTNKVNTEKTELIPVCNDVKDSLSLLAKDNGVTVSVEGGGYALIGREHARELIKNLVENGIRYNHNGGFVKVTVKACDSETVLTVEDDGAGIPEEDLPRVFERFFRANKSRSRATGGTGLGLSIVKHVCELYGAEVKIASRLGEGTTVTVIFPLA